MEQENIKSAKLNIDQFTELHHCIPDWITEVRKLFYEGLSEENQQKFDADNFEDNQIEALFKKFDYVLVDETDCFYGVKENKRYPLSQCDGAWDKIEEWQLAG